MGTRNTKRAPSAAPSADRVQPAADSLERLLGVIASTPDAIITIDEHQRVTMFNPAAERMFRCPASEAIGSPLDRFIPERYRAAHRGHIRKFGETGVSNRAMGHQRALAALRADGVEFPVEATISQVTVNGEKLYTAIVRDVTERQQAAVDQERLLRVLSLANVLIRDLDDRITNWNRGAQRLYGFTAEEACGRVSHELLQTRSDVPLEEILRAFEAAGRWEGELTHTAKDGRTVVVLSEWTLFPAGAGRPAVVLEVNTDVTARKEAEKALARQAEALARSNVELERFAYVASHDLQEPMRTVRSFAQLLKRRTGDGLTGDAAEYLRYITSGVERMQTLINDLLAYSRVSSQGAAFAPADCGHILKMVLESLQATIAEAHATVTSDALPVVMGDATQLGQLFQNLITNAIKFRGKDRPPRIHVSAAEHPHEWVFSVRDNGIGIAPEYFERIFIIFQRLHTIEEYGGTGIGLAVCKKIVERHGGRIWVESKVNQGTTFFFSIAKREKAA